MGTPYVMRQASMSDLETVLDIVMQRAAWLSERGSDQWNRGTDYRDGMISRITHGQCWVLEDEGLAVGTASFRRRGKPAFWTEQELAESALYGWKMATIVERNGQGLGKLILRWLQDLAAVLDLQFMRWTSWHTNEELQAYWRSLGAELVRIVEVEGKPDGALFQLPALRIDHLSAAVRTVLDDSRDRAARHPVGVPATSSSGDKGLLGASDGS